MNSATLRFTVKDTDSGQRLDSFLAENANISRTRAQKLIQSGNVKIKNANKVFPSDIIKENSEYILHIPEEVECGYIPENMNLDILYEDDDIIIINKAAGIVVHPAPGHGTGTLLNGILHHIDSSKLSIGGKRQPGIIHRIDQHTSGAIVVAKNDHAMENLSIEFGKQKRLYEVFVWGNAEDQTIDKGIARHNILRQKQAISKNGKPSVTHFVKIANNFGVTYGNCILETGRTHQIRVHMNSVGNGVIGDILYGRKPRSISSKVLEVTETWDKNRHALHASILGIIHPVTKKYIEVQADLPSDLLLLKDLICEEN
jgi:23S rRNA pseudouridine1911/1915/1917 synthase